MEGEEKNTYGQRREKYMRRKKRKIHKEGEEKINKTDWREKIQRGTEEVEKICEE